MCETETCTGGVPQRRPSANSVGIGPHLVRDLVRASGRVGGLAVFVGKAAHNWTLKRPVGGATQLQESEVGPTLRSAASRSRRTSNRTSSQDHTWPGARARSLSPRRRCTEGCSHLGEGHAGGRDPLPSRSTPGSTWRSSQFGADTSTGTNVDVSTVDAPADARHSRPLQSSPARPKKQEAGPWYRRRRRS